MGQILDDVAGVDVPCARCRDQVELNPRMPISQLFRQILIKPTWGDNTREPAKAFALSCFAQLSYMRLSRYDVEASDRYDFIPSEHLDDLISTRQGVGLEQVFAEADLPLLVVERPFFTYLAIDRGDFAIVAVRGTAKASEWLTNLNAQKIGGGGADVFVATGGGLDRVLDFNFAQGDRVGLLNKVTYSAAQVDADTVVTLDGGAQMVLVGVQLSGLSDGWITMV